MEQIELLTAIMEIEEAAVATESRARSLREIVAELRSNPPTDPEQIAAVRMTRALIRQAEGVYQNGYNPDTDW
jgi:hypothetical protein